MTLRDMFASAVALALLIPGASAAQTAERALSPEATRFERSLHKQTGDVAIGTAHTTLHLGERYYVLPAEEAKTVLTKIWGNPPASAEGVLGLVLERGTTIFDNVWSAVVTYEATGYVPDKDAKTEDYDAVLQSMRDSEGDANTAREKQGYSSVHLVGWAQPPSYDPAAHSLIWARDIKFGGDAKDTLNYDVRLLGRSGVLSLNMISTMDHLADVRAAAADFGKAATFDPGSAYADYDPQTDKTAEYGLAGLVAAGTGVAIAKKLGFLAIVLGLGKKLLVLVAIAGAAIARFGKRLFGRRGSEETM